MEQQIQVDKEKKIYVVKESGFDYVTGKKNATHHVEASSAPILRRRPQKRTQRRPKPKDSIG